MKKIEITVTPAGEARVTTLGFVGRTCTLASPSLERVLGIVTENRATNQTKEQQCHNQYQQ